MATIHKHVPPFYKCDCFMCNRAASKGAEETHKGLMPMVLAILVIWGGLLCYLAMHYG